MVKILDTDNLEEILFIENSCFSTPLSENNIRSALLNDKYTFTGYFIDNKLVGYGSVFIVANESYINNIAVLKEYRNQGIATEIIEKIIKISDDCEFVTLEVRESNITAVNLYKKNGFKQVAIRKNYYNNPNENAIIMTNFLEKNK